MLTLKKLILNTAFYLFFFLLTILYTVVLTLLMIGVRVLSSDHEVNRQLRLGIRWYGRILIWVLPQPFLKVKYTNKSRQENKDLPCIVICNHRSSSDPFLMACLSFDLIQIVNKWPFRIPFLGWVARLSGYLSVNEMSFEEFRYRCGNILDQGVSVVAFPEGTRSGSRAMGQFRSATFRIALEKKVPIVPLCITGNEDKPLRGSFWLNPGTILIHKLPPVPYEEFKDFSPFKLKNYIRDIIERETKVMDSQK
ncbi:MAG: 1-acyl-sn-glycerol-3-phosphate acyltransferase [Candidatus Omnitrophica bacterium]|nr:1-acyl-sn-glycerol-3-phosphate acyltransferase [Candidatus Omnitrophota bacterium]